MAEFEKTCHLELSPQVDILQNGRRRITRRFELGKNGNIDDVIFRAYQDPDPAEINDCTAGYANLRMIQQRVVPQSRGPSVLEQVFETLTDAWAEELDPKEETGENGRLRRTKVLIALPDTDASGYVVGTSTDGSLTLAQKLLEKTDGFWRLTLVYGDAGVLSRTTSTSNNGALSTIVIESANEVPATPPGYVLTGTQVVGEAGFETTRYTFAKGEGEISRDPQSSNNGKLLTVAIRRLSAPDATLVAADFSAGSGFVLVAGPSYQEADGHRVWSATFAKGEGEISRSTSGRDDGTVVTIRALSAPSTSSLPISAPAGFVLIDGPDMQEAEGHRVWSAAYAKGNDVPDTDMNGLRRRVVTAHYAPDTVFVDSLVVGTTAHPSDAALILARKRDIPTDVEIKRVLEYLEPGIISKAKSGGPASLPGTVRHTWLVWALTAAGAGMPGIITDEDEDNVQGYPVRRFTSLSNAGGSSPAGTLATYPTTLEITRHGTVQVAVSTDAGGETPYLVQTPPRSGRVAATVTVELTTTPAAPVPVAFNLDNLSVTVVAKTRTRSYVGSDPSTSIDGHVYSQRINMDHTTLRGYIIASTTNSGVEKEYEFASAVNPDGDTTAGEAFFSQIYRTITLSGSGVGAAPPTTGLYSRDVDPVFTALDGTKYFRVTTVTI